MNSNLASLTYLLLLTGGIYLLAAGYTWRKGTANAPRTILLTVYLLVLCLASVVQVMGEALLHLQNFEGRALAYGILISSVLLLQQIRSSLAVRTRWSTWLWWGVGIVWLGGYLYLDFWQPPRAVWALVGGWLILMGRAAILLVNLYRKSPQVLTRRQLLYWYLVLIPILLAHVWFLLPLGPGWTLLQALGVVALVYVLTTPRLPDFMRLVRQLFSALLLACSAALLYGLLAALLAWFSPDAPATTAGLVSAVLLGLSFVWLWRGIQRLAERIFPPVRMDPNRILREYSLSVSNILDPDRLATVAIGLISEAIEVHRGLLILVARETTGQINGYRLKGTTGMGVEMPPDGFISSTSPIAAHFTLSKQPLTQYEMDFSPTFAAVTEDERHWFARLEMDLYVPIYAKEDWIGLLALGSKDFGQPYAEEDIDLLCILADQTAVALQNARLVESLMRVNNDFRRAYAALEASNRQLGRANAQLEKLDKAKTDFIAIASHELRTPLTVMRGYTEMLQDDPLVTGNGYYKKLVSGIHSGIMRFHEIVDSMLDIAMIDNRTLNLALGDVSLEVLIRILCGGFKEAVAERQLNLTMENLQGLPPIQGDPEALRKVFYHLIINAIKYTPDGGHITISGRKVAAGEMNLPDEGVEVVVKDTGIGIDPEYHDLIFAKFYQTGEIALHSSGKTKFKGGGPGLGLTIAKGIVEAHGGRIWVESPGFDEEKCPGSQFHVFLPLRRKM